MRSIWAILSMVLLLALAPAALASTTWYVDGVNGNDGNDCKSTTTACKTIGHAISLAASGDSISVAAATYTENLTINSSLNITGSNASTTIIDGSGVATVITIPFNSNARVTLSNLTIRDGFGLAGGIATSAAILTISRCVIEQNSGESGGGISATGNSNFAVTINDSTISGNSASNLGGGIENEVFMTINRSTVSGNTSSAGKGGGIWNFVSVRLRLINSTISGNSGDGIYNEGDLTMANDTINGNIGNGLLNGLKFCVITCITIGSATLWDTIIANSTFPNCYSQGQLTSNGYNLSSDSTCNLNGSGDLNNTNPLLGPLQNNGGPTQTHALLPGSPAIDAGNPKGCTDWNGFKLLKTDQRGMPRPDKEDTGGCDMGAYESQSD